MDFEDDVRASARAKGVQPKPQANTRFTVSSFEPLSARARVISFASTARVAL